MSIGRELPLPPRVHIDAAKTTIAFNTALERLPRIQSLGLDGVGLKTDVLAVSLVRG
jgi:hypothetical protein